LERDFGRRFNKFIERPLADIDTLLMEDDRDVCDLKRGGEKRETRTRVGREDWLNEESPDIFRLLCQPVPCLHPHHGF
jgi:hypothetical protein